MAAGAEGAGAEEDLRGEGRHGGEAAPAADCSAASSVADPRSLRAAIPRAATPSRHTGNFIFRDSYVGGKCFRSCAGEKKVIDIGRISTCNIGVI